MLSGSFKYSAGLGSVGSYQVSGMPWITGSGTDGILDGSQQKLIFPSVTKSITVINTDVGSTSLRVHFNATGSNTNVVGGNHYVTLDGRNDQVVLNMKCRELWISNPSADTGDPTDGTYLTIAELTGIAPNEMLILTGSGISV